MHHSTEHDAVVRCKGKRGDGSACGSRVVLASGWCNMHDPNREAERAAQRKAGGRARSNVRRAAKTLPAPLAATLDALLSALREVHSGSITPSQGTALAALATAIVRIVTAGEFEDRIAQLEAALKAGNAR